MHHRHGFAAMVMGTMTLTACTLEPQYVRPNAPVTTPESNVVYGIPAEDLGWRAFFPDPQLQQLIVLALANNRDLRVAALNVETAQARYRIQRADLFPTIAASTTEHGYLSALDAQRSLYGAQQQLQLVRLLRLENRVTFYKGSRRRFAGKHCNCLNRS
jgi:outer membrane protein TolC